MSTDRISEAGWRTHIRLVDELTTLIGEAQRGSTESLEDQEGHGVDANLRKLEEVQVAGDAILSGEGLRSHRR